MLVQRLELEDIKSYRSAAFDFREGVHFISGENGSGKTTLIEAIGFALFSAAPSKYDHFVRQGAPRGVVRVGFLAEDEREYVVERGCSTRGQERWTVWDVERNAAVDLHGSDDAVDFLRQALNARGEHSLPELYRELIAIPQGTFTAPFLETTSKRKKVFDALLRVDDYRIAYDRTSGLDGRYKTQLEGFSKTLDTLRRETEVYDARVAGRAQLKAASDALALELDNARARFADTDERLKRLETRRAAVEDARSAATQARSQQIVAAQKREAARVRLAEAHEARNVCRAHREAFNAFEEANAREKSLRERDDARRAASDTLAQSESKRDSDETRRKSRQEQRNERAKERDELAVRVAQEEASLAANRADAETAAQTTWNERIRAEAALSRLDFLDRRARDLKNLCDALGREESAIAALTKQSAVYDDALRALDAVRALAERVPTDKQARDAATQRVNEIKALRKQAEKNRCDAKGGNCPILNEPCQNVGGDLERHFVKQLNLYDDELDAPTTALEVAARALAQSEAAAKQFNELDKTDALRTNVHKQIAERKEAQQIARQGVSWDDWERSLKDALEAARSLDDDAGALRREHQELIALRQRLNAGDVASLLPELPAAMERIRAIHQRWSGIVSAARDRAAEAERSAVSECARVDQREKALESERKRLGQLDKQTENYEQELARLNESLERLDAEIAARREALAAYDDVEPALNEVRETLAATRESHAQYLQFRRDAAAHDERKEALENAERLAVMETERSDAADKTLAERASGYDDSERARVAAERDTAQRDIESLSERRRSAESDIARLDGEIATLDERKQEMAELEARVARTAKARALASFIRADALNHAAKGISTAYRESVSHYAATLYRRLARENVELRWTEDYDIRLNDYGGNGARARLFEQLSGGEQMSAALAVRLALMRILSGMSLAIFDEPTTNLDSERRERLAQSLPELRSVCRQLFIVSHDDAFDSVVDEVIRIEKTSEAGSRRVDA